MEEITVLLEALNRVDFTSTDVYVGIFIGTLIRRKVDSTIQRLKSSGIKQRIPRSGNGGDGAHSDRNAISNDSDIPKV